MTAEADGAATIPALLAATAAAHPDVVAVVDGDVRLTYAELAGLPDEDIRKIMGGNLARLMNVEDAVVR